MPLIKITVPVPHPVGAVCGIKSKLNIVETIESDIDALTLKRNFERMTREQQKEFLMKIYATRIVEKIIWEDPIVMEEVK